MSFPIVLTAGGYYLHGGRSFQVWRVIDQMVHLPTLNGVPTVIYRSKKPPASHRSRSSSQDCRNGKSQLKWRLKNVRSRLRSFMGKSLERRLFFR